VPDYIRDKIKEFNNFGITIHILDTTSLQVPSIVVVAINEESEIPQVFVTAGTSINFFEAIVMSLNEMIIGVEMFYYKDKEIESEMNNKQVPFIANIGQVHRQLYWRGRDKVDAFKWFLFGKVVSYRDLTRNDITCKNDDKEKLNICLEILRQKGEDYYPVVYYPKNKIQAELGFHVAQVFIPKAFPLYLSEYFGTFDSDRLQEFAESKSILDWKLNPLPHMFP
jgi:ribosomal protein S12 methylthiotransferase accessory factor YcaO